MIFCTCFAYHFRHAVGSERWDAVLAEELRHLSHSQVPGLRTIGCTELPGTQARVSVHASTIIARSRSKAAGELLRHGDCDVWLTVDEDVFAYGDVTAKLIRAARATRGVVSAPCWLRLSKSKGQRVNFHYDLSRKLQATPCEEVGTLLSGADLRSGFGLVAIHRSVIEQMAREVPWVDDEQGEYPAIFADRIFDRRWVGEDFAFCLLAEKLDVPVHVLCDVITEHAGALCSVRLGDDGELQASNG